MITGIFARCIWKQAACKINNQQSYMMSCDTAKYLSGNPIIILKKLLGLINNVYNDH